MIADIFKFTDLLSDKSLRLSYRETGKALCVAAQGYFMTETLRLEALRKTALLDTVPEERFDRLTRLAANALDTNIALVSFIDQDRQWFKSKQGLDRKETPRDIAFCAHAIQSKDVMVVADAKLDARFLNNPLVTGDPNLRFYAGAPLITKDGHALGTLCVLDDKPREDFGPDQQQILADIAASVMTEIEADAQEQIIDELNVVNEELQHRMGNMYAHVSSLISIMSRTGVEGDDFAERLHERVAVLAETQALIASNKFESALLSDIFETTIAPFVTPESRRQLRVSFSEDIEVSARGAFTMTLMLNELVTNAVKHGALKDEDGTVSFSWVADGDVIKMAWREKANLASDIMINHKGFGSQILTRIVPLDLQGEGHHEVGKKGLNYTVSARRERIET